ncbi:MAG: murein biosynthesis integral membrane protein MurJ [Chloroflexi bacterium]|nr:murein biosynthesis integral membrane protein MurJ [Chloroflexota bacterium]
MREGDLPGGRPTLSLAGAALILMAAFVLSRVSGLVRNVAVTYQFGTGREMDAFVAGIRIPDLLFQIVAGGAVASAFIPVVKQHLADDAPDQVWALVSTLFNLAIVVLSPLVVVLLFVAPWLMGVMAPEFEPEYQALAGDLARILLISPLFFTIGCFTSSLLNSFNRFFLASLAPTTYNAGIIFGALVLAPTLGIRGLALGATLGSLGFLLIQLPGLYQVRMVYRPILALAHPGVRRVGTLMLPRVLGLGIVQVNFVVTLYLASGIPGATAALNYAWQLTMLPLGIFAMAIGTAVFPSLADQTARAQLAAMERTVVDTLRVVLFLTIPAGVGLVILAQPIVRVLFERGSFQLASTEAVAGALQLYAIGLIGMAVVEIVTRAFYALQDTRTPVAVAGLAMVLNAALAVALLPALGYRALALALAVASLLEAVALFGLGTQRLPGVAQPELGGALLRNGVAAALMGLALVEIGPTLAPWFGPGLLAQAVLLAGQIVLAALVYVGACALLGVPEVRRIRAVVAR